MTGSVMEYAPINLTRPGRAPARHAVPDARSAPTTTGRSSTPTSLARRPQRRRGEGGAGEDRRAQRRAAARLRHRRGQLPRHRPRDAPDRPRQRRHRLRQEAHRDRPRPAASDRKRASSGPTRTTPCCAARSAYAVARRRPRGRRARSRRSAACARCATAPGSGRDPLQPVPAARAARGARRHRAAACSPPTAWRLAGAAASLAPDFEERSDAVFAAANGSSRPTSRSPQRVLGAAARARSAS